MRFELWLGLAGFILICIGNIVIITRYVSSIESKVNEKFNVALNILRKEFEDDNAKQRHEFVETLKPLQTHIANYEKKHYQLELYIRDNYIEVPTFQHALKDIKDITTEIFRKLDKINEDSINWRRGKSST